MALKKKSASSCSIKSALEPLRSKVSEVFEASKETGVTDEIKDSLIALYQEYPDGKNRLKNFLKLISKAGFNGGEYPDLHSYLKKMLTPKIVKQLQIQRYDMENSDEIFKQATSAMLYVQQYFINKAFKHTFLNRDKSALQAFVFDGPAFNAGIVRMKNDLANQIIKYLGLEALFPSPLFTGEGAATHVNEEGETVTYYEELMKIVENDFIPAFDVTANPNESLEQFDTFSAIYILNNFDKILQEELAGIVKVNLDSKGDVNNTEYAKETSRTSTIYWAEDSFDAHGAERFTSHLAKFIISTIPKMTTDASGNTLQVPGQYLTTADMFMLAGILKQAEYEYNLIHSKDDNFVPLVFNDDPKYALKKLLMACDEVPIMKKYGHDIALSFKTFLYTGTQNEYGVEQLFNGAQRQNFSALDIENLLSFEINKNVNPTYVEYDKDGKPTLRNYGKSYKASSKLDDNIVSLLWFDAQQDKSLLDRFTKAKIEKLQTLEAKKASPEFREFCRKVFQIQNINDPQYQQFLEDWHVTIMDIIIQAKKFSPKLAVVDDPVLLYQEAQTHFKNIIKAAGKSVKDISDTGIKEVWKDFKDAANKFMATEPVTNFTDLGGSSIPVNRLTSAFFGDTQFIWHYHEGDPNRELLNFFANNPNTLSRYNFRTRKGVNQDFEQENVMYETQSGYAISAGDSDQNSGIDEMTPEDQLFVSFMGNWLGLSEGARTLENMHGIVGVQPAPYSDKKSIGLKYINLFAEIELPWELFEGNKIKTLAEILHLGFEESYDDKDPSKSITKKDVLEAHKKSVEDLIQIDYFYRKNQKISLINKLISDWCVIAEELGEPIEGLVPYTQEELTKMYQMSTKIPEDLINKMFILHKYINELKSKKVEGQPNYQRDLQDKISRIATKHGIQIVDELYCSKDKFGKGNWGLNQTLIYDVLNLKNIKTFTTYFDELFKDFYESPEVESLKTLIKRNFKDPKLKRFKDFVKVGSATTVKLNERFRLELMKYMAFTDLVTHQYTDLVSKEEYLDPAKFKFTPAASTHQVTKVISGGQTGVDTIGLQVARQLGIQTGGTAPKNFERESSTDKEDIRSFGLQEITDKEQEAHTKKTGKTDKYTARTYKNVLDSDGTVYFHQTGDENGLQATITAAELYGKPYIINPTAEELHDWLIKHKIKVLNVAGNRGSKLKNQESVKAILLKALGNKTAKKVKTENKYSWAVKAPQGTEGYEVSTAGDSRFSARVARFAPGTLIFGHDVGGRTIESVYQHGIKQGDWKTDNNDKTGKPTSKLIITGNTPEDSYKQGYLFLWEIWAEQNPELMEDLAQKASGKVLTDKFVSKDTTVSQARALADILNEIVSDPMLEEQQAYEQLLKDYRKQEKSARIIGMSKRMVLYPATIETFQQNTLTGVSPEINVCVVDDSTEETFNMMGLTNGLKIFDGAAFISVFYSHMENNSQPGKGIKGTKKPLGVSVSDESSALFKYAEFEINNERIRNSKRGKFDMERLFRKMHDMQFEEDIDLTRDIFGHSLELIPQWFGKDIYITRGFNYYLIESFKRVGVNSYQFTLRQVDAHGVGITTTDESGNTVDAKEVTAPVTISSIYDLWTALGGCDSRELIDGELVPSEVNNELISQFIYRVGSTSAGFGETLNQGNVYLPLRKYMVSMLATKGCVKRGSANNVSSHSVWETDEELPYFKVSTKNFGIQLDANHHSDLAELTEMSQTISALASLGYTRGLANEAYEAISKIIDDSLTKVSGYLSDIEKGNIRKVLQKISIQIVKDLKTELNITTARAFVEVLKERLQDGLILPVSDKRFYKIFAKQIIADLNKSSIKRKYSGLGGILNPASNILQIYSIGETSYLYPDILLKARQEFSLEQKQAVVTFLNAHPERDINDDIVTIWLMSLTNPDVFNNLEEAIANMDSIRLADFSDYDLLFKENPSAELEYWNLHKVTPKYGFKAVSKDQVNVLDVVMVKIGDTYVVRELNTIEKYLDFKYGNYEEVYISTVHPHDLRPQIEHWSAEIGEETVQHDNWSEPYVFMAVKLDSMDPKDIRGTNLYYMVKGLLQYQFTREYPGQDINQLVQDALDVLTYSNGYTADNAKGARNVMIRRIKQYLKKIRMRQAELHANGKDFGKLEKVFGTSESDITYNWEQYLGDINIGLNMDEQVTDWNNPPFSLSDLQDYIVDPAEVIMPKIYRSNFNFGQRSLHEITPEYFRKAETYYRCSLKDKTGKSKAPVDVLVRTHTGNFNIVVGDIDTDKYGSLVTMSDGDYQLNERGERLFKIDRDSMAIYLDKHGNMTVVVANNQNLEDNILDLIATTRNIVSVQPFLENVATNPDLSELATTIILTAQDNTHIKTYDFALENAAKNLTGKALVEELNRIYITSERNYKHDLANTLYNSFVKTLDIISTRIPTQALQSFMAMRVKALTNDESNNVFVSRWQFWLQGSDLDIDKSYMMGVNISDIGQYDHWSPIADYSTIELANISDKLPLPNQLQVTFKDEYYKLKSGVPVFIEFGESPLNELLKDYETLMAIAKGGDYSDLAIKYKLTSTVKIREALKLEITRRILEHLDTNKSFVIDQSFKDSKAVRKLLKTLNYHNRHIVTPEAARNIVAKSMHEVALDGRNMVSGYSPIDDVMAMFTDELKKRNFDQKLRNLDDVVSTFRIQYENAVGKKDVGIMANGLKVFFAMTQYFNNYWKHATDTERARFFAKIDLGTNGKHKIKYHATISDIQVEQEAIRALNLELRKLIGEAEWSRIQEMTVPGDDASLLISSLVSLATDNAKELALAKLNAGINLACMHVYLTVMGYSAAEIVDYTTSPLFQEFTKIIAPSQFDRTKLGRINEKAWKKLKASAKNSAYYTEEDVENLRRLYSKAQEMTSIAKILGINQGIKVDEFEASEYIDEFQELLSELVKRVFPPYGIASKNILFGNNEETDDYCVELAKQIINHRGMPETPDMVSNVAIQVKNMLLKKISLGIDPYDFSVDMHRYFNDVDYREFIADSYEVFKDTFNVYDIISHSKHFYSMLKAFDSYISVLKEASARAKFSMQTAKSLFNTDIVTNASGIEINSTTEEQEEIDYFQLPFSYNAKIAKSASRFFDDYILSEFLLSNSDYDFQITIPKKNGGVTIYDIRYGKDKDYQHRHKNRDQNIQKFITFVNTVLIPAIQDKFPDNTFVNSLIPDTTGLKRRANKETAAGVNIKWKLNFNLDQLNSPSSRNLYFDVVDAFDLIAGLQLGQILDFTGKGDYGKEILLGDILYLYDQILNFSSFGQGSIEKVFDHYIVDHPELPLKIAEIETQHDLGLRQINADPRLLMAFILRSASKHSTQNGIIKFSDDTQVDTNAALINLSYVQELANDYYYDTDLILEALRRNIIQINPVCN